MLMVKTDLGHQVMKDRSVPLTPRQRSAFILFDGKRSVEEILAATATMGVVAADIEQMEQLGLVKRVEVQAPAAAPVPVAAAPAAPVESTLVDTAPAQLVPEPPAPVVPRSNRTPQERYFAAYPIATALTASLGLRGFRLNLAVEGSHNYEDLMKVAPRIQEAVGPEKYAPLDQVLNG